MPETQAISVGAIASNYQRLRVENVASRLGLTVLAYLWERDQTQLLGEMVSNGVEAILIKVACVGLTRKHLGQSLAQIESRMAVLKDRYQVHPCGEGGEYESIVLDCPLFVKKLHITSQEVVVLEGETAYLKLKAETSDKIAYTHDWQAQLCKSATLMEEYQMVLQQIQSIASADSDHHSDSDDLQEMSSIDTESIAPETTRFSNQLLTCTRYCITPQSLPLTELVSGDRSGVLFCSLVLRDMSDFARINQSYGLLWTLEHPPSRVCVSTALPSNIDCILYTIAINPPRQTRTQDDEPEDDDDDDDVTSVQQDKRLWVQGRSYWAPSNIGPYSQITVSQGLAFVSGQIGLIPSSMVLAATVAEEVCWSLQSLHRILQSQLQSNTAWHGALICYLLDARWVPHVTQAYERLFTIDATSHNTLIIVELHRGSRLPRAANVEWQYLAAASDSPATVSCGPLIESEAFQIIFSTNINARAQDSFWNLPVRSIWLSGVAERQVAISISAKE